jgi:hypothetical protein
VSEPDPPDAGPGPASGRTDALEADPGASGSIDVRVTDPAMTAVELPDAPSARKTGLPAIGARVIHAGGRVVHAAEGVGARVVHAAEGVGGTVARAGGAVVDAAGASLSQLPVMPKTRRGRVMARSVVVSFILVFGWIAVIVGLQLRGSRPPDLRPDAERILIALRDGRAGEVYDAASIRFQGVVRDRETFVDRMTEMNNTLGDYVEITAVIATETARGPGGRTGRLDVSLEYEKAQTRGSISFRWEDERWKLLGLAIEVPDAIASNKQERTERSTARPDEIAALQAAIEAALVHSAKDEIDALWAEASPAFQQAISVEDLRVTERDRRAALGPFDRVLDLRGVRLNPGRNAASLIALLQYQKATITGSFELSRIDDRWRLVFYKLVMPVLQVQPLAAAPAPWPDAGAALPPPAAPP